MIYGVTESYDHNPRLDFMVKYPNKNQTNYTVNARKEGCFSFVIMERNSQVSGIKQGASFLRASHTSHHVSFVCSIRDIATVQDIHLPFTTWHFGIWNFVFRHIYANCDLPVVGSGENRSTLRKPLPNPKSLATFSHAHHMAYMYPYLNE